MVSRLRKVLVVFFMMFVMLAGSFGWGGSTLPVSALQSHHISSQHLLADGPGIHCPPPPYECY